MNSIAAAPVSLFADPFFAYELFALLSAIPLFILFRRAGLKPWPTIFVFVPMVGLCITGTALAFPRWPVLPERKKKVPK